MISDETQKVAWEWNRPQTATIQVESLGIGISESQIETLALAYSLTR